MRSNEKIDAQTECSICNFRFVASANALETDAVGRKCDTRQESVKVEFLKSFDGRGENVITSQALATAPQKTNNWSKTGFAVQGDIEAERKKSEPLQLSQHDDHLDGKGAIKFGRDIFTPCGHRFHVQCIKRWLDSCSGAEKCPICRTHL